MIPKPNQSESYYIGWFKQHLGTNDATVARKAYQEYLRTGKPPARDWDPNVVRARVRLIVVKGDFGDAVDRAGEDIFTSEIVGVEHSGRKKWTKPGFDDWVHACMQYIRKGRMRAAFVQVSPATAKNLMEKAFINAGRRRGESCWFVVTIEEG
jgi:hypothetical protein